MGIPETFDIERFRARETIPTPKRNNRARKPGEWFLRGPIPGTWLKRAGKLPGKAVLVSLAVWYQVGVDRVQTVKLCRFTRDRFGITRYSLHRGLAALEKAGLVTVVRAKGSCPVVTILELEP